MASINFVPASVQLLIVNMCEHMRAINIYTHCVGRLLFNVRLLLEQELYGAHTSCAASRLHAARESLICFVYIMNISMLPHFNFAGRETKEIVGSAVVLILQPLCVFYFVTLLISSCQHSFITACEYLINSQRALALAFRIWRMHMHIIAVDVTNRRVQQKAQL